MGKLVYALGKETKKYKKCQWGYIPRLPLLVAFWAPRGPKMRRRVLRLLEKLRNDQPQCGKVSGVLGHTV